VGTEPSVVNGLRNEAADIVVHAPGGAEEHPAVRWDGRLPHEQVIERRLPGMVRVNALNRLLQLHLVAEEDDVLRAGPHGDEMRHRDLPCLVHEEVVQGLVQLRVREQPGGAGHECSTGSDDRAVVGDVLDHSPVQEALLAGALLDAPELDLLFRRAPLHGREQVVDGLVAVRGDADPRASLEQRDNDLGAGVRLAGAGRPLDEQVAFLT
jgi:hypothetical protein